MTPDERDSRADELIEEALDTDGGHHKQWYLHQLAELLLGSNRAAELADGYDEGVAP